MLKPWTTQENSIFMLIVEGIRYQQESESYWERLDNPRQWVVRPLPQSSGWACRELGVSSQPWSNFRCFQVLHRVEIRGRAGALGNLSACGELTFIDKRQGNKNGFWKAMPWGWGVCTWALTGFWRGSSHYLPSTLNPMTVWLSNPLTLFRFHYVVHECFFLFLAQGLIPYYVLYLVVIL